MAAAGGDGDRFALIVFHAGQRNDVVAGRMDTFQPVANRKAVLDLDFHEAAGGVEGDGIADVVYADEINLYVYSGTDGAVKLLYAAHDSGTIIEYPIVADVDNDGDVA